MTNETKLQEAIGLAREGRKTEARWLLEELLRADRANEAAWLWYADCVETVDERMLALERCLRHNPDARMARAGLDLLRNPRPAATAQEKPNKPAPFTQEIPAVAAAVSATAAATASAAPATAAPAAAAPVPSAPEPVPPAAPAVAPEAAKLAAVFIKEPEASVQAALDAAGVTPAFELTPEDEWLLSDGAAVFTVSPEALSPEELQEMAARTEAFLEETRPELRPYARQARRRARRPEEWQELERTSGSRAPTRRRKNSDAVEIDLTRTATTTLTALAVVIFMVLLLGAAIVLRGV